LTWFFKFEVLKRGYLSGIEGVISEVGLALDLAEIVDLLMLLAEV